MSELMPSTIEELLPGDAINFADLSELVAFEDMIVGQIEPVYDTRLWQARIHLRNLIRPPKFNGTIADISLTLMADPYDRLLSMNERGFTMIGRGGGGRTFKISEENEKELKPFYRGFEFDATARSSKKSNTGRIRTELWYYPLTMQVSRVKAGSGGVIRHTLASGEEKIYSYTNRSDVVYRGKRGSSATGRAIGRVVAKPKLETKDFTELYENSRQIGFAVLRDAMSHPYRG